MESVFEKTQNLVSSIKDYINTRIDVVKLSVAEKASAVIANLIAGFVMAVVLIFFVFFASIALAIGIGNWLNSTWLGFLLVAGLYLLIGLIVWTGREKLIRFPAMNAIIRQLFKDEEDQ